MSSTRVLLAIAGGLLAAACGNAERTAEIASAVENRIAAHAFVTGDPAVDDSLQTFYSERTFAPAWITSRDTSRAHSALNLLGSARQHGLSPRDEQVDLERELVAVEAVKKPDPTQLAELDVRLTRAVLQFGRDAAIGTIDPTRIDSRWTARRQRPDLAKTLAASVEDLDRWIAEIQPQHPEYEQLRQDLVRTLAKSEALANSASTATGAPPANNAPADKAIEAHIRVLTINMERWRWMPDDLGDRHLLVNVPAFGLRAREHGVDQLTMRVVVGQKNGNETPIFSGDMQTVVLSPAWNVPDRIAREETLPAVRKDHSYIERQQLDVFRRVGARLTPIAASDIDWDEADEVANLAFRQRPGPGNALGHVKFLFPNRYDVYLHDTPNDTVFARSSRALSHGCIRLSEPARLAQYVLRDQPEWDDAAIETAMHTGKERHVKLTERIPVHITYFTAWPASDGSLEVFADVYGYDAKQAQQSSRIDVEN